MRKSLLKKNPISLIFHNQFSYYGTIQLKNSSTTSNIVTANENVNRIPQTTCFDLWTGRISVLAQGGSEAETALHEVTKMLKFGIKPDCYALVHLVRVSADLDCDLFCQQLHSYILKSGFASNVFISNALMKFYKKVGDTLDDAHKLFVEIPQPNVISWNSLICGYVQSGEFLKGMRMYIDLERSEICANAFSFTAALTASGQLNHMQLGRSIHSKVIKSGIEFGVVVANCLIDMYGRCGFVNEAIHVFEDMNDKDIISWNSIVASCARNGELELTIWFFNQIPYPDTISYNELISCISQFGNIDDAINILSVMRNPNSSSWTSILTGYVNRNQTIEALQFFSVMHSNNIEITDFTYSIILSGVANLSALTWGMLIHCSVMKCGLNSNIVVGSALIDMYSKCGQVNNSETIFHSMNERNIVTWNAMISGYAHNGDSTKVIELFDQLKKVRNLKPDQVTFLNILAACSHEETPLEKVITYFESMINDYKINPTIEHCCSMVRVMAQRGEEWRALRMINEFGFGSVRVVWRALLGGCKDLRVAKLVGGKMIGLGGDDDEYLYVMMSNMYASFGKWKEVGLIRKFMNNKGVRKETGCSWIEVENVILNSSISHND